MKTAIAMREDKMAEYIDREKAKSLLHIEYAYAAEQLLDEIPAADVAPVVRCKDCVHCGFCGDATNLQVMGFYGFCSRGERKDGGDDRG